VELVFVDADFLGCGHFSWVVSTWSSWRSEADLLATADIMRALAAVDDRL
jgi:hypothetical protein